MHEEGEDDGEEKLHEEEGRGTREDDSYRHGSTSEQAEMFCMAVQANMPKAALDRSNES